MSKTAIIYWSGTGNTEAMANAIFDGAKEVNADTKLFSVDQITADEAKDYNNLIFGCPAMGAEELEEGEFEPTVNGCVNGKRELLTQAQSLPMKA